jgi:tripartite-type tricarboxylate transporter receptor subunit TctC
MKSPTMTPDARPSQSWLRKAGLVACSVFLFNVVAQISAGAQAAFPNKPVRIFLAHGPGGVGDLTMRMLAEKLSQRLKQQFVIDNRPGAAGLLSARALLSSPPDGYSLGNIGNATAISVSLFKTRPYNALTDFSWVSVTSAFEVLLAVRRDSPFQTVQNVLEAAMKNPRKLNFGTINPGTTQHLSAHLFKITTGIDVEIVPYRTTPELLTAMLRGDVDRDSGLCRSSVRDSRQPGPTIATAGEARSPHTPAFRRPWKRPCGLHRLQLERARRSAGLPVDIRNLLNREINAALADPDVQKKAHDFGMEMRGAATGGNEQWRDIEKWARVIEKAKIPKE